MKKAIMIVLLLAMALAIVPMIGHAECSPAETDSVLTACVEGETLTVDGNAGNPDPFDGYIQINGEHGLVCADSEGSPSDEDADPTCGP